jgi:magnesium-transporting ATPase (P-type)
MFVSNFTSDLESLIDSSKSKTSKMSSQSFRQFTYIAKLCNNSYFIDKEANKFKNINQKDAIGNATDIALLKFAAENFERFEENYTEIFQV